jgi:hypothetical protein
LGLVFVVETEVQQVLDGELVIGADVDDTLSGTEPFQHAHQFGNCG